MNLSPVTESFGQDDQSWLGSAHGTDSARSITLDVSKFTSGTHYPNGYLISGQPLGKVTASGKYGPYNDAAADGTQTCVGLLFTAVPIVASNGNAATTVTGAMLVHCIVVDAKLPIAVDAAGKVDVAGRIIFV